MENLKKKNKKETKKTLKKNKKDKKNEETKEKTTKDKENELKKLAELEEEDITYKLTNSEIYCRDNERKEILEFLSSNEKKILFISGQPGTGKTSLVSDILKKDNNYFGYILNCMSIPLISHFSENYLKHLNNSDSLIFFKNNLDEETYEKFIELLDKKEDFYKAFEIAKNITFVIVLDEVDYIYKKADEVSFYNLVNIPFLNTGSIKMILISNNTEFDLEIFPKFENRKITLSKMVFTPYQIKESFQIIKSKLNEMNMLEQFSKDSLVYISKKLNQKGDIRPIIQIVKGLILQYRLDINGKDKKIGLEDIFKILKQKNVQFSEVISSLTVHQKIIVATLYYIVLETNSIYLTELQIYNKFKEIEAALNISQLEMTEFKLNMKYICECGIAEINEMSKKGTKKKTMATCSYKISKSLDDLELVLSEPILLNFFKKNQSKIISDSTSEDTDENQKDTLTKSNSAIAIIPKSSDLKDEIKENKNNENKKLKQSKSNNNLKKEKKKKKK